MFTPNWDPNGSKKDCIFDYVEKRGETPIVVLPLANGRMVDVWTFLVALHDELEAEDITTAMEMVEWIGTVVYDSLSNLPKQEKPKNIAEIYRKETSNFDERLEQFLRSLEGDGNGKTN